MCTAQPREPARSSISPVATVKSDFTHRKKSPAAPMPAPIQLLILVRCFKNMPSIGTSTIYKAVIKAVLPASVETRATCCKFIDKNITTPAIIPPFNKVRPAAFVCSNALSASLLLRFILSLIINTGTRAADPKNIRIALYINGPITDILSLWATRAKPHIKAVPRRHKFDLKVLFIFRPPLLSFHITDFIILPYQFVL